LPRYFSHCESFVAEQAVFRINNNVMKLVWINFLDAYPSTLFVFWRFNRYLRPWRNQVSHQLLYYWNTFRNIIKKPWSCLFLLSLDSLWDWYVSERFSRPLSARNQFAILTGLFFIGLALRQPKIKCLLALYFNLHLTGILATRKFE